MLLEEPESLFKGRGMGVFVIQSPWMRCECTCLEVRSSTPSLSRSRQKKLCSGNIAIVESEEIDCPVMCGSNEGLLWKTYCFGVASNLACVTRDLFRSSGWSVRGWVWESAPRRHFAIRRVWNRRLGSRKLRSNLLAFHALGNRQTSRTPSTDSQQLVGLRQLLWPLDARGRGRSRVAGCKRDDFTP